MAHILSTRGLAEALKAEGFPLPAQCREARLVMQVNQPWVIQYDVFLTDEDLLRLGRALIQLGQEETRLKLKAAESPD